MISRRGFLAVLGSAAILPSVAAVEVPRVMNRCGTSLPDDPALHAMLKRIWDGLDPGQVWDMHVHIAGTGDSGTGIAIAPQMNSPLYPKSYAKRLFLINAGCARQSSTSVDEAYIERLLNLCDDTPPGFKLLLLALDRPYNEDGQVADEAATLYVSNEYACQVAARAPDRFAWACSIHPYRRDAVAALHAARDAGAVAVKWLPAALNFNPGSPLCDPFYEALSQTGMPLLVHVGEEETIEGQGTHEWYNPLLLRRALDLGVKVIMAHCASHGEYIDWERHIPVKVPAFDLFARLMDEPRYRHNLFGDISAIVLRNRKPECMRVLLEREEWHDRLLYGSDYPLPGVVPLVWLNWLVKERLLEQDDSEVLARLRHFNPLLFNLALMRCLSSRGRSFSAPVFHTRRFFERG